MQSGDIVTDPAGLSWLVLDAVISDGRSLNVARRGPVNRRVRLSWLGPDGSITCSDYDENQRMKFLRLAAT